MRRRHVLFLLVALPLALLAPATPPAAAVAATPLLVDVRAGAHPGFDRVVFEFRGGLPSERSVEYVDEVVQDPSGRPLRLAGLARLQVRLSPADAHRGAQTVPARTAYDLPNVMTTVRAGDTEAVTTYGIGLTSRQPFRVSTLPAPPRVVVDVDTVPTVRRPVWLFDVHRFATGSEPYFRPVLRWTLATTPATVLLHRLYAGPTREEQAAGLRLLRSRSTGFTGLRIADGTARVQLLGGCSSGGSTVTVAGEIFPTLKQFPTVDHVVLYDPRGTTEDPGGGTDSVPECLEP